MNDRLDLARKLGTFYTQQVPLEEIASIFDMKVGRVRECLVDNGYIQDDPDESPRALTRGYWSRRAGGIRVWIQA